MTLQKKFFFTSTLLFVLALTGLSAIYFSQIFHLRATLEQQILQLSTDYYAEKFLRFHEQYSLLATSIDSMGNLDTLFAKDPILRKIVRKKLAHDLQLLKDKYPLIQQIKITGPDYEQSFAYPEKSIWPEGDKDTPDCVYQVLGDKTITLFTASGENGRTIQFVINISDLLEKVMNHRHNISLVVAQGNCGIFIPNDKQSQIISAAALKPLLTSVPGETITLSETEYLISRISNEHHPMFVLESLDISRQVTLHIFIFLSLFILFFSIVILTLTHLVSKCITRPIQKLANHVATFQKGRFTPLPINSNDEVGALSKAFNTMGIEIQAFTETLESKIRERTNELEVANNKLAEISNKDALTKLHNRRFFDTKSSEIYELAGRSNRVFCMALIDIDFFKRLNDRFGHQIGDQCLVRLAEIMIHNFQRSTDYIARYGGEEFAIFTLKETTDNFTQRLEGLRREVAGEAICETGAGELVTMTISIGYCLLHPGEGCGLQKAIAKADEALYLAKANGRNRVEEAKCSRRSK